MLNQNKNRVLCLAGISTIVHNVPGAWAGAGVLSRSSGAFYFCIKYTKTLNICPAVAGQSFLKKEIAFNRNDYPIPKTPPWPMAPCYGPVALTKLLSTRHWRRI